ncbi:MAG: AbrB/MazE/SpoVT family DNA-binding domain-containing protein [ANME-2 cluster archaeon]|nr:AbrB/MazE/SpoVT family DNA-binding domain-containing protein [ANME-2 cluster archaeon]MDF1557463.1 AbrB/MazE/SpoVT family DNA-binding domain-containing protein [ANME-2 cluster archaeon]
MQTITISAKGQVIIPANIRKKLDLKKGEKLAIMEEEGYIKMIPPADLTSLCGAWSDLDTTTVRKQIEDMRKEERS